MRSIEKIILADARFNSYIVTMTIWAPALRPSGPRYLAIAEALENDVREGRLAGGDRLPTQRALAERLGVTVGTVTRGYAEAARRGLLDGEVGRGTFVRSRHAHPEEPGVVDLSHNHPPVPPGDTLRAALAATLGALTRSPGVADLLAYPPDGGDPSHREAGAAWLSRSGLEVDPTRVLVSSGSQHALAALLASRFRPGDRILAESCTYPGLKAAAELLHLRLEGLAMDAEGLVPEAFESACRRGGARGLYCVPTIQNPTAAVMPSARREAIATIARRHDVAVIEDDIHALLPEVRLPPISALLPELSYHVTTTSKSLAPGLRIAYLLGPPGEEARLQAAIRATTWAASPLMAEVASAWIRDGTAEKLLEERRREAASRQRLAAEVLHGVDFRAHPFGYHLWLTLPEPWRADAFVTELARRGVAVTPAEVFAVGRSAAPHAVRVGLGGGTSREQLRAALETLADALRAPRGPSFPVL